MRNTYLNTIHYIHHTAFIVQIVWQGFEAAIFYAAILSENQTWAKNGKYA